MKNGRGYAAAALLSGAGLLLACQADEGAVPLAAAIPQPPPACTAVWSDAATDLVDRLAMATSAGDPVWLNYGLSDGTYVVYAGDSPEGGACLGVWQGGKAKAYTTLAAGPKLLTPLYGYHYPWQGNGGPFDPLVANAAQPGEVAAWLAERGVESAVIVPVHVSGLPFEVSRATQVQIALHEAFHVEVQAPRWLGPGVTGLPGICSRTVPERERVTQPTRQSRQSSRTSGRRWNS